MASSQAVPVSGNPSRSWASRFSSVLGNSSSPAESLNDQSFSPPSRSLIQIGSLERRSCPELIDDLTFDVQAQVGGSHAHAVSDLRPGLVDRPFPFDSRLGSLHSSARPGRFAGRALGAADRNHVLELGPGRARPGHEPSSD